MSTITTIQGTDSLSASRLTLNNNFAALNSDVVSLISLVDITTGNLTGVQAADVVSLSIDGGSSATFNSTLNSLDATETEINGLASLNGGVVYDVEAIGGAGMPAGPNAFTSSTYVVDGTQAGSINLASANQGQEITIIADQAPVGIANANTAVAGVQASIDINVNGTLTLRYVGTSWYVISSFLATIS